jgi:hypothetical protein
MPDDASAAGISEVGTVFVPVADQDRSLEFFVGKLGFEKRADFAYGGQHRWIEVARRARRMRSPWSRRPSVVPPAATWLAVRSRRRTSRPSMRPCAPEPSLSTPRSRARARRGRGSSRLPGPSRIRFRRSSSSATRRQSFPDRPGGLTVQGRGHNQRRLRCD